MADRSVVKFTGRRVLNASVPAPAPTFRRLVEDCPSCSSTETRPLSYHADTFPYSVYECRRCAHVWRFLQADIAAPFERTPVATPTDRHPLSSVLMPICPMCHSSLTEDLDVRPSILPDSLWRCKNCGDIWRERGDTRPKFHPRQVANTNAPRR
jgi:uncharacterized Zn finger protein